MAEMPASDHDQPNQPTKTIVELLPVIALNKSGTQVTGGLLTRGIRESCGRHAKHGHLGHSRKSFCPVGVVPAIMYINYSMR